jgi:alpha-glucosidase (family GH31 glycosyl hydrolase)
MIKPLFARASFLLLIAYVSMSTAFGQQTDRKLESFTDNGNALTLIVDDGQYTVRPYSEKIVETTFVPKGETFNPQSHAVVLAPAAIKTSLKDAGNAIEYATSGMVVSIVKSPFKISYAYRGKQLISEKHGYAKVADGETLDFNLDDSEALYGGGARVLGMNRRGYRLALYNKAHYGYETHSELMNYTMPLVLSSNMYAIHFDNAQIGYLDLDSGKNNTLTYQTIGGRKTYQVIAGDSWQDLISNYTDLTGRQPLPPRWAFGNFASRFGYHSAAEAKATVDRYIADGIPLDAIIFDLYWFGKDIKGSMGNLAFLADAFPDPQQMIADFNKKGVKTILVTEPFILTTSDRWQEAVQDQVLATDTSGKPYTYDFYFGNTGLIDIFSEKGRDWFWNIYKGLIKQGVAGWWGDLGEPEVHPSALQHATGSADQVHNIYGHEWAKMIAAGYRQDFPSQRPFILMRSGYSGSQRFGLIPWSGDVNRTWGGLQAQPEIALQMGMQGLAYMHSDLGGFAGPNLDDELYTRWLQYGVFQPIFRPHAQEQVASEPVYRDAQTEALAKQAIQLRYRLLPYNYTLAFDNNQRGTPLMRPLFFEEPGNVKLRTVSDSYLWGSAFLVAPILSAGVTRKEIYFPAGSDWFDFLSGKKYRGGTSDAIAVSADHIPVFVRGGAFVPMAKAMQNTNQYSTENIALHYYHDAAVAAGSGKLYDDDGMTPNAFEKGQYEILRFASRFRGKELTISLASERGANRRPESKVVALSIHHIDVRPRRVTIDQRPVSFTWDANRQVLEIPISWDGQSEKAVVVALSGQTH